MNAPAAPETSPAPIARLIKRKTAGLPVMTIALAAFTAIVFLAQQITQAWYGYDPVLEFGAKYGPLIFYGEAWRLITPVFLHLGWGHFLSNMYSLYVIGSNIEPAWGKSDFLIFYLMTGFTGNVFSYIFNFRTISAGASTAIFGTLVASAFLILRNRDYLRSPQSALGRIGTVIALNFLYGLRAGIDNWGHLGGFVGGTLICALAAPKFAPFYDAASDRTVFRDSVPKTRRRITFAAVFLLFAAAVILYNRTLVRG